VSVFEIVDEERYETTSQRAPATTRTNRLYIDSGETPQ